MKTLKSNAPLPRRKRSAPQAKLLAFAAWASLSASAVQAQPTLDKPTAALTRPGAESITVVEDESVRIEETRSRGQLVRVQVQSKLGQSERYDIIVRPGRDQGQPRGSAGQSAWQLFSF